MDVGCGGVGASAQLRDESEIIYTDRDIMKKTAAFAAGIFMARGTRINLCTKL